MGALWPGTDPIVGFRLVVDPCVGGGDLAPLSWSLADVRPLDLGAVFPLTSETLKVLKKIE